MSSYITQNTLQNDVSCESVGVHSGAMTTLTLKPAPENSGIVFVRTDVTDKNNKIPARWDLVTETQLCTVLTNDDGVQISTVEHVLSALWGCGVDNAIIEVSGYEIPIMDGSAIEFIDMIKKAGICPQDARRQFLMVKSAVSVDIDGKTSSLRPSATQSFHFEIEFDSKAIGHQRHDFFFTELAYQETISKARTFGFLHEVEALRSMGLARGGSLDNAIVIDGDDILNAGGLRYDNEFVRHKILDALGDLLLAGGQIIGHYDGIKAGHHMNNQVLRKLFDTDGAWEFVELTEDQYRAMTSTSKTMGDFEKTGTFVVMGQSNLEQVAANAR